MSKKHKTKFSKEKQGVENELHLQSGFGIRETKWIRNSRQIKTPQGKRAPFLCTHPSEYL